ncbi:MAG: hypothetical protein PVG79_00905 [Gemmatimonadales bacterium]|jgi:hypothetical protein
MKTDAATGLLLSGLRIRRGRIVEINGVGEIEVESEPDGRLTCDFLKTGAGPPVVLKAGDPVLYALDDEGSRGYVLGLIQKYESGAGLTAADPLDGACCSSAELRLRADQRIEIRCGRSLLAMDKEGKILIRGVRVTSRAGETNRIKGGTVKIN